MSEQEIKEGNELIAKWMGFQLFDNPTSYGETFVYKDTNRVFSKSMMKYHSSWDWLMPVVKKFLKNSVYRDMTFLSKGYREYHRFKNCLEFSLAACDLENIFFLLTEAIKWDNTRKQVSNALKS